MSKDHKYCKKTAMNNNCLFVGGLNPTVDRKQMRSHFSKYGKISNLF